MFESLLDIVFPRRCASCAELLPASDDPAPDGAMCAVCADTLEPVESACARCGLPGDEAARCPECAAHPPVFDGCCSSLYYGGAVARMLHRFKYEDHPELAGPLAEYIVDLELPDVDIVASVPLHASRRRMRTYDQSLYLAQAVAKSRSWGCDAALLSRVRPTGRQVGLTREARTVNVRGAFTASSRAKGKRVLLIDDVVTTGATASECARALKKAGAKRVHVASVARAV